MPTNSKRIRQVWRLIPDFEKCYEISNLGNIRRVGGGKGLFRKPTLHKNGYWCISLYIGEGRTKIIFIHRVVARVFLNVQKRTVIHHKDNDRTNNAVSNLQIGHASSLYERRIFNKNNRRGDLPTGVHRHSYGGFVAQMEYKKKKFYLGYFKSKAAAAKAYNDKLKEIKNNLLNGRGD